MVGETGAQQLMAMSRFSSSSRASHSPHPTAAERPTMRKRPRCTGASAWPNSAAFTLLSITLLASERETRRSPADPRARSWSVARRDVTAHFGGPGAAPGPRARPTCHGTVGEPDGHALAQPREPRGESVRAPVFPASRASRRPARPTAPRDTSARARFDPRAGFRAATGPVPASRDDASGLSWPSPARALARRPR